MRRRYTLGRRQIAIDATRQRIVRAARDLLASPNGVREMTIEAVARVASVTRATVYQRFETKQQLLAAVLDDVALEGGLHRIPEALKQEDPYVALDEFIAILLGFYASDRDIHRHLSAMAEIDPTFREIVSARQGRRRAVLEMLAKRIDPTLARAPRRLAETSDALFALTSAAMFDQLAGSRALAQTAAIVQRLARAAIAPA